MPAGTYRLQGRPAPVGVRCGGKALATDVVPVSRAPAAHSPDRAASRGSHVLYALTAHRGIARDFAEGDVAEWLKAAVC